MVRTISIISISKHPKTHDQGGTIWWKIQEKVREKKSSWTLVHGTITNVVYHRENGLRSTLCISTWKSSTQPIDLQTCHRRQKSAIPRNLSPHQSYQPTRRRAKWRKSMPNLKTSENYAKKLGIIGAINKTAKRSLNHDKFRERFLLLSFHLHHLFKKDLGRNTSREVLTVRDGVCGFQCTYLLLALVQFPTLFIHASIFHINNQQPITFTNLLTLNGDVRLAIKILLFEEVNFTLAHTTGECNVTSIRNLWKCSATNPSKQIWMLC